MKVLCCYRLGGCDFWQVLRVSTIREGQFDFRRAWRPEEDSLLLSILIKIWVLSDRRVRHGQLHATKALIPGPPRQLLPIRYCQKIYVIRSK